MILKKHQLRKLKKKDLSFFLSLFFFLLFRGFQTTSRHTSGHNETRMEDTTKVSAIHLVPRRYFCSGFFSPFFFFFCVVLLFLPFLLIEEGKRKGKGLVNWYVTYKPLGIPISVISL